MPSTRNALVCLAAGVLHAAVLLGVAIDLGYAVGPGEYEPYGLAWRYGGLVLVAALPVWLALEYRIVAPLVALVLTSVSVLGMELSPPGPTFHDVADLEPSIDEPTGITVVENGLYVVRYTVNASVWAVGFLLLGLVEYAVRTAWPRAPRVRGDGFRLPVPADRRTAAAVAAIGGGAHAAAMVWFAARLGVSWSGGAAAVLYLYGAVGMFVLAAVPLYLLLRQVLVAPALLLALLVLNDVRAEFGASVEDAHALYFGAWFVFLGVLLVVAMVEYGLRVADVPGRLSSGG